MNNSFRKSDYGQLILIFQVQANMKSFWGTALHNSIGEHIYEPRAISIALISKGDFGHKHSELPTFMIIELKISLMLA